MSDKLHRKECMKLKILVPLTQVAKCIQLQWWEILVIVAARTGEEFSSQMSLLFLERFQTVTTYKEQNTHNNYEYKLEIHLHNDSGIMVWVDIILSDRTDQNIFTKANINNEILSYEVPDPYVKLFRGGIGDNYM